MGRFPGLTVTLRYYEIGYIGGFGLVILINILRACVSLITALPLSKRRVLLGSCAVFSDVELRLTSHGDGITGLTPSEPSWLPGL
jgi:hypothetical protein